MYKLEDGTELTEQERTAFKRGMTRAYIKYDNVVIDQDNYLMNVKYRDEKADPDTGEFIGITSMREITVKLNNYENALDLENKDVEYHLGAKVGNEYKYINFGNFIVQKPNNEEVNEETTFTALDYMCKFDIDEPYTPQVVFPTTVGGLAEDVCNQVGVELGNINFRNANVPIYANPFLDGENPRTVLKSIAKLSFSCCYIGQDNKLYFNFDVAGTEWDEVQGTDEVEVEVSEEQTAHNYIIEGNTEITNDDILGVGDLVETGEHQGEYVINITNGEDEYNIYLDKPLYKIGDICDYIDFSVNKVYTNIGRIDSYNGEVITTPYFSTTGDLTIGATVIYLLEQPDDEYLSTEDSNYIITENYEYILGE